MIGFGQGCVEIVWLDWSYTAKPKKILRLCTKWKFLNP